ncbi:FkbM family methyltransferase [Armatimonas sp.]|uniref:FkbM family methyltransferase n=1 Tax=Armatimonas sp. TaxID=1872638 RepID=UPI00286AF850|nr:FkbM family methyltransferase [Armatimonas sp.]
MGWYQGLQLQLAERKEQGVLSLRIPGLRHPIYCRANRVDRFALVEVLFERHNVIALAEPPQVIFDVGANVGYSAVLYANLYPQAKIIALEPAPENYQVASRNVSYYPNITLIAGALWPIPTMLSIANRADCSWAYQMHEKAGSESIRGWTMPELLEKFGLRRVDFLKVDIMGAEEFVFAGSPAWLEAIQVALIKPHSTAAHDVLCAAFDSIDVASHKHGDKLLFRRASL